jgi:hypothetical protein
MGAKAIVARSPGGVVYRWLVMLRDPQCKREQPIKSNMK